MTSIVLLLALFILPAALVAGYQNYKIAQQPAYDPGTMLLNYEIVGTGERKLVLLHGLTGSLNYWKRNLEKITKTHSLLLIDLLGFGDSPKPNCTYSLSLQLESLEKILEKEGFNDGKTIIGGHSMGAIISLALLEKQPTWFKAGIFIGIPVYKNAEGFKQIMSTHSFFDRILASKLGKYICMVHPISMTHVFKPFKPDNFTDDVFEDSKKHNWQSFYYSLNEIILNTDLFDIANGVKDKEVLFLHGKKDTTAPIENAISLSEVFTNVHFVISPEGDHQFFLQGSDFIWQTIQHFKINNK
ncbi:pimeloyl-ACP methyl ester carboxylesterase [Gillisia sp. Hel_I_86]|uniref:alpha/beta fold hydrolase n=1 Tax=Gillisia sp. Hel_I_86 TaxID=1249981 RepID=UPI00119A0BC2|nr:alpha/beta hydrolase [Gillisia sp. Hel_I_86]TVZ28691.1 pimeloyl-ACP methyl ester carboxylesterase [Gillisia sp. Hel_I_86]